MTGFGYDLHRLASGRKLIIGGIEIPFELGAVAHSDGDVALHALCDALLGAAGLGDIGEHFPDSDAAYKDMDSSLFVKSALKLLDECKYFLINIDITIVLEKPSLKPYKESIRNNIASICGLKPERVNIKAKTNEQSDSIGKMESIAAYCICEIKDNAD